MTFPDRVATKVYIGGIDYSSYAVPKSLKITNALTAQIDTVALKLQDVSLWPEDWQEILIYDGSNKVYGGYVLKPDSDSPSNVGLDFSVSASDYSIRLSKIKVKVEYQNMTDAEIIAAMIDDFMPDEGFDATTHVHAVRTHERMRFNRITVMDAIKKLASWASADWYVDEEKRIHFFTSEVTPAPFGLSDTPDFVSTYPYNSIKVSRDGSGVENRIEVVGGTYLSNDATFSIAGTGADNRVAVPFKLHAPSTATSIQVYRNDGTEVSPVWTQLEVLVGYIDQITSSDQVLFYFNEKILEQQDSWPNLPNAVGVVASYEVPLRTRVVDQGSYNHYGMWFDGVVSDSSIITKSAAKMAAKARLAEKSFSKPVITLKIEQPGLRSGQVVNIKNTLLGINSSYLIQKVVGLEGDNGHVYYDVTVGTYSPTLIDLILKLAKATESQVEWREDEVVDDILQLTETVVFSEAVSVSDSKSPYYISPLLSTGCYIGFCTIAPVKNVDVTTGEVIDLTEVATLSESASPYYISPDEEISAVIGFCTIAP